MAIKRKETRRVCDVVDKKNNNINEDNVGEESQDLGEKATERTQKEVDDSSPQEREDGGEEPQKKKNTGKRGQLRAIRKKVPSQNNPPFPQIQIRGNKVVEVDLKEDKIKNKVCPKMEIAEIKYNTDTKEIAMTLEFDYHGETISIEIDRSYFEPRKLMTLQRYGLGVYPFNINNVIKHLVNQEIIAKRNYTHTILGMMKGEEGEYIFNHYKAKGKKFESTYSGDIKIEPKGTKKKKVEMIQKYVLGRTALEAILAMGFSSALVGMIAEDTEIDNPIIHLSGDSTTGKTTALMLAASLYGSPNSRDKGIFSNWNGTKNALFAKLRDNYGIVAVFDEASMSKINDFSDVIYMLAAGSDKERLNKNSELKDKKEWNTTILSNGEHSLTSKSNENTGLKMRKFEFSNVEWTESAEHSDYIKNNVLENYGHLGVEFAEALIEIGKDEVIKLFRDWVERSYNSMDTNNKFSKRLSKPMSIIMTSAQIARDKLIIDLNLEKILKFLIDTQTQDNTSNDIGIRAYEYFLDMYSIHSRNFIDNEIADDIKGQPNEVWGRYEFKSDGPDEILIIPKVLKRIMKEGGFEDINVILRKWRDKGYLDCDKDRYTRKRFMGRSPKRVNVIKIKDDFFSDEENEEYKKNEEKGDKKIIKKSKVGGLFAE